MSETGRRMQWMIWLGLGMTALLLVLAHFLTRLQSGFRTGSKLPIYGTVASFALTNQQGKPFGLGDLKGRVWVADIVFTRCAGPGPILTRNLRVVQEQLGTNSQVQLVTLTTDPEYDTPEVLYQYGRRYDADPSRWTFLTGNKQQIVDLAVNSLRLASSDRKTGGQPPVDDLFIYSTTVVLVDKQARIRGVIETAGDQANVSRALRRVVASAKRLEREP